MLALLAIVLDRDLLREALAEQGYVSRTTETRVIVCDLFPTRGAYGSDGTVYLDYSAAGTDLDDLRTRVHEEMHGVGPEGDHDVDTRNRDEVATELATHAFFKHYGITLPSLAYQYEYARLSYTGFFQRRSFSEMTAWAVAYKRGE